MMYRCALYTVNCALHRANVHSTVRCTLHCTVACTGHCAISCTCRFLMETKTGRILGSLPGSQGGAPVLRYTRIGQVSLYKYTFTLHTAHKLNCLHYTLYTVHTVHSFHYVQYTLFTLHILHTICTTHCTEFTLHTLNTVHTTLHYTTHYNVHTVNLKID